MEHPSPNWTKTSLTRWTAIAVGLIVLAAGCGNADPRSKPRTLSAVMADADPDLATYYRQKVEWKPCKESGEFDCASVKVPLDYADPGGEQIGIAVNRLGATGDKRIASLLTNPGGPGASGLEYLGESGHAFDKLRAGGYDMIGFDPRGVGRSSPVQCKTDKELDAFYQTDLTPDTAEEKQKALDAVRSVAEDCEKHSGERLPHMGTENVARDMDIIRGVLGDDKMHYLGTSYGTLLGQVYAAEFPDNIGRVVLDSVEDPSATEKDDTSGNGQNAGMERSLSALFRACTKQPKCAVGTSSDQAMAAFDQLLEQLDAEPLELDDGRHLTDTLARIAAGQANYDPKTLGKVLTQGIAQAYAGEGQMLMSLADMYLQRDQNGHYNNVDASKNAVECLVVDPGEPKRRDPDAAAKSLDAEVAKAENESPHFGALDYLGHTCDFWPVEATSEHKAITKTGTTPIVLVNNTGDPATPLHGAENVADAMRNSRLIVNEGHGHGVYGEGHRCADAAINGYLLEGKVPPKEKSCQ